MRALAVILAGGLSRRMGGGDKSLLRFGDTTLLERVVDRLSPQVEALALNANGDPARFDGYGLPVLPDPLPGHPGPLAGILAAMEWAAAVGADSVVTVPADAPFLPGDLVPRLFLAAEARPGAPAVAQSGGRLHPVFGLWPVALAPALRTALASGTRKVTDWTRSTDAVAAEFPPGPPDPFLNLNTPAELEAAARWL